MNSEYLITIILCAFNEENKIEIALSSIIKQTYQNFQLIVVDDCSTDNTLKKIQKFKSRNERIQIISNKHNIGLGASRNVGINYALGTYLFFMDADDYLYDLHYFYDVSCILQKDNPEILVTPFVREIDGKYFYDSFSSKTLFNSNEIAQLYLSRQLGTHAACGKFFKKILFKYKKFCEYGFNEDVNCILTLFCFTKKCILFKRYGYVYVRNANSITQTTNISILHIYSSIRLLIEIMDTCYEFHKKNFYLKIDEFVKTWRREHGAKIKKYFLSKNEETQIDFIETSLKSIVNFIYKDNVISNINQHKLKSSIPSKFLIYLKNIKFRSEKLVNKIAILLNSFQDKFVNDIAINLKYIFEKRGYKVFFILDSLEETNQYDNNLVFQNNILDFNLIYNLQSTKYIFDLTKKNYNNYFLFNFIIDNFSSKTIILIPSLNFIHINFYVKQIEYILRKAKFFILNTRFLKNNFLKIFKNTKNTEVISYPLPVIKKYKSKNAKNIILSVDYYNRINDLSLIIESFFYSKLFIEYILVLIGYVNITEKNYFFIENHKIKEKIIFANNIEEYLVDTKFLCQPFIFSDLTEIKIAYQYNIPCLTTNIYGANKYIHHRLNGYLINTLDIQSMILGFKFLNKLNKKIFLNHFNFNARFESSLIKYLNSIT